MFVILVLVLLRKNRDNRLCINHKPAEIREYFIRVIVYDIYDIYCITNFYEYYILYKSSCVNQLL